MLTSVNMEEKKTFQTLQVESYKVGPDVPAVEIYKCSGEARAHRISFRRAPSFSLYLVVPSVMFRPINASVIQLC